MEQKFLMEKNQNNVSDHCCQDATTTCSVPLCHVQNMLNMAVHGNTLFGILSYPNRDLNQSVLCM